MTDTYDPVDVRIGHRLRQARQDAGWNQSRLALVLGVSFQQVQKYEQAENRMSAEKLWRAACALGKPIDWFFEGLARRVH